MFFAAVLVSAGIFARGFLLTRVALERRTESDFCPECAGLKRFRRAVIVVIDALRLDFVLPSNCSAKQHYHDVLTLPWQLWKRFPDRTLLMGFRAHAPTTTLQRLKSLVTGGFPTFVDAGANFFAERISEDNLVFGLNASGKRVMHAGDDTWNLLFGSETFVRTHPFPSFDVMDLDTVDAGVREVLAPALKSRDWDVLVAHFLGVDHCGHRYGPRHPEMRRKLEEMNDVLTLVVEGLGDDALLVVMGDHGMTETGDHGGDSLHEVSSALLLHSKTRFGSSRDRDGIPIVDQIDLVPTLALLLGVPIPFSNAGRVIFSAFENERDLLVALEANRRQIRTYLEEYSRHASSDLLQALASADAETDVRRSPSVEAYRAYFDRVKEECVRAWASFETGLIWAGVGLGVACCVAWTWRCGVTVPERVAFVRRSPWGWIKGLVPAFSVVMFLSNSFVIAEERVLVFFVATAVTLRVVTRPGLRGSPWGLFAVLGVGAVCRAATIFHKCREETSGWCVEYVSHKTLGDVPLEARGERETRFALAAVAVVAVTAAVWVWLREKGNLAGEGGKTLYVRYAMPFAAVLTLAGWVLRCAGKREDAEWVGTCLLVVAGGGVGWIAARPLMVWVVPARPRGVREIVEHLRSHWGEGERPMVFGLGSAYSAFFLVLFAFSFLPVAVLMGDVHAVPLGLVFVLHGVFAWLEASEGEEEGLSLSPFGAFSWSAVTRLGYFSTGHDHTFASIQWEAAFAFRSGNFASHAIPALLVGANTFGVQVLSAMVLPLYVVAPAVMSRRKRFPNAEFSVFEGKGFAGACAEAACKAGCVTAWCLLGTMLAAGTLRRHLMVWKIFAPRFVFEAVGFAVLALALLLSVAMALRVHGALDGFVKKLLRH